MWSFVKQRALELDSPVFQLFMKGPFSKPWVIVTDFRENQDIQSMRQGEFDRSTWLGDVFGPLLPGNHVWVGQVFEVTFEKDWFWPNARVYNDWLLSYRCRVTTNSARIVTFSKTPCLRLFSTTWLLQAFTQQLMTS